MMETHEDSELCFPKLLNASCRKPKNSPSEVLVLHILLFTFSPLTVFLNLLVIISVSHFRQLHTPTNLLLLSLAVSDLIVGLVLMPREILLKLTCWFLGDMMCSFFEFLNWCAICVSVGDMVLISVNLYLAVCDPLHYTNKVTVNRVKVCICLCWFCSFCYCTGILNENLTHPGKYNNCHGRCVVYISYVRGIVAVVATFILPISAIIVLYMSVFVVAVSQAHALRSHVASITAQPSGKVSAKKSELKAARTLYVFVLVFFICYCPCYCVYLTQSDSLTGVYTYMNFLMFLNSCFNPMIYALFYPWFRKAVKLIFTLQILQPDSCDTKML